MANPFEVRDPKSKLLANGADFVPTIHNDTYDFIKPEQFDLSGRSVFVTGASKGIGRESALSFARAGASFIGLGARSSLESLTSDVKAAAKKAGRQTPKVVAVKLDVEDFASAEAAASEIENAFGKLDILINNAGYLEPFVKILDSKPEDWHRAYTVNVFGVYHVSKAFLPLLLKTQNGLKEVLTLSSIGAHVVMAGGSGYQPSKLAVTRFSEFISAEYPEMLAYSIHPGGVLTELAKNMGQQYESLLSDKPQLAADSIVFLTAQRREWLQARYVSATWDMKELLQKRERIEKEDLLKVRMAVGFD